ncbi:MAG: hypothetical protein LBU97_03555 [Alistipes sp.]|jgi:hypothetical protein|nr:hypothetical protein [Alistipes sp.]
MNYLKIGLKALILTTLTALTLASCGKGPDTPPEPEEPSANSSFVGTFTVAPGTDDAFTLEGAEIRIIVGERSTTTVADMQMLRVKFAERMPEMDITIPGLTMLSSATGDGYQLRGDGIVPTAMGGPVERYTITDLVGEISMTGATVAATPAGRKSVMTPATLTVSMMCGIYPLSFTGRLQ